MQTLRRRGQTFWKCRERRFVSYNEEDDSLSTSSKERYRSLHKDEKGYVSLIDDLCDDVMKGENCPEHPFELLLPLKIMALTFATRSVMILWQIRSWTSRGGACFFPQS